MVLEEYGLPLDFKKLSNDGFLQCVRRGINISIYQEINSDIIIRCDYCGKIMVSKIEERSILHGKESTKERINQCLLDMCNNFNNE